MPFAQTMLLGKPAARTVRWTVGFVAVAAIASMAWIYSAGLVSGGTIRSDGVGYYLYLPAGLLDHDVTMRRTAARSFGGDISAAYGVRPVPPHGRLLDKYPIGEAVMLVPFFLAGHLAADAFGSTTNGFSRPYQVAAAAGGLTYVLLGLLVLGNILTRWFARDTVVVTLLAITFGTNLFHYATYDAVFSHAFSFFLCTCAISLALRLRDRPTLRSASMLGFVAGLITVTRPTNAVILVFLALIGVVTREDVRQRLDALRQRPRLVAAGAMAFALPLLPQMAYWHEITGRWIVYSYGDEHFDFFHPHVIQVLFSVRKGLLFWTPLLFLALAGIGLLRRRVPALFVPALVFLALDVWIVASWQAWWYGGSFGQRPFVEATPVFALGLASFLETMKNQGWIARAATLGEVLLLTALALNSMLAYWKGIIPFDGTTWHEYVHTFTKI